MKLKKMAVWGFLFAGVLGVAAGLRDWFAPWLFQHEPSHARYRWHHWAFCPRGILLRSGRLICNP